MRKRWVMVRNILVMATEAGGFMLWLRLPLEVPIHWSFFPYPDAWGNKFLLLLGFILPLLSFFPGADIPELHSDCEESRQLLEKARTDGARTQVLYAVIECGVFWMLMGTAYYYAM